jgi:hypothetical protein
MHSTTGYLDIFNSGRPVAPVPVPVSIPTPLINKQKGGSAALAPRVSAQTKREDERTEKQTKTGSWGLGRRRGRM